MKKSLLVLFLIAFYAFNLNLYAQKQIQLRVFTLHVKDNPSVKTISFDLVNMKVRFGTAQWQPIYDISSKNDLLGSFEMATFSLTENETAPTYYDIVTKGNKISYKYICFINDISVNDGEKRTVYKIEHEGDDYYDFIVSLSLEDYIKNLQPGSKPVASNRQIYHDAAAFGLNGHVKEADFTDGKNYLYLSDPYVFGHLYFNRDGSIDLINSSINGSNFNISRDKDGYITHIHYKVGFEKDRELKFLYNEARTLKAMIQKNETDQNIFFNVYIYDVKGRLTEVSETKNGSDKRTKISITKEDNHRNYTEYAVLYKNKETCLKKKVTYWDDNNPIVKEITLKEAPIKSDQAKTGDDYYYGRNGKRQDYTEAFKCYNKAAQQGDADAQNNLGNCYLCGNGVQQDYQKAVSWFRMAAAQENAEAQNNLGNCYYYGHGVNQDFTEAVRWYRKASVNGNIMAQCMMAYCYEKGQGVSQSYSDAAQWYHKAAQQGYALAQYNLGIYYEEGKGLTKDIKEAKKWYRKAADQGLVVAEDRLACLLMESE